MIAIKLRVALCARQRFHHRAMLRAQRLLWNVLIAPADHARSELYRRLKDEGLEPKAIAAEIKAAYPPGLVEKAITAWLQRSPLLWAPRAFQLMAAGHKLGRTAQEAKAAAIKRAATLKGQGAAPEEVARCARLTPKHRDYLKRGALRFQLGNKRLAGLVDVQRRTVRLPSFGTVRYHDEGRVLRRVLEESPEVTVDTVRLKREGGHYFAVLIARHELADAPAPEGVLGLDRGITTPLCGSDGESYGQRMKRRVLKCERRLQHIQSHRDRKQTPGSSRYRRSSLRLARLKARQANIREAEQQLAARDIASKARVVKMEDLRLKALSASASGTRAQPGQNVRAKSDFNRELLALGLSAWAEKIERQVTRRGGEVRLVAPAALHPRCPQCPYSGAADRRTQARWACENCSLMARAEMAAAVSIAGTAVQAETGSFAPYAREGEGASVVAGDRGEADGASVQREPIAIEWAQGVRAVVNRGFGRLSRVRGRCGRSDRPSREEVGGNGVKSGTQTEG